MCASTIEKVSFIHIDYEKVLLIRKCSSSLSVKKKERGKNNPQKKATSNHFIMATKQVPKRQVY